MAYLHPCTCPECGKNFLPAPMHRYVVDGRKYCRYNCYNAALKKKEQEFRVYNKMARSWYFSPCFLHGLFISYPLFLPFFSHTQRKKKIIFSFLISPPISSPEEKGKGIWEEEEREKENPFREGIWGGKKEEEKCHIQNHVSVRNAEKNSIPLHSMRMLWEERSIVGIAATMPYWKGKREI